MLFVRTKLKHRNLNVKLFQITYYFAFLEIETFTISVYSVYSPPSLWIQFFRVMTQLTWLIWSRPFVVT